MDLNQTVENVIEMCEEGMLEDIMSISNVHKYDAVVYKLLRLNMNVLSRLNSLYSAAEDNYNLGLVNGQTLVASNLLNSHIKLAVEKTS